jgi:hypothetical protein
LKWKNFKDNFFSELNLLGKFISELILSLKLNSIGYNC